MKNKINKLLHSKYLPFILFFIGVLCFHLFMPYFGDDKSFGATKRTFFDFIIYRYLHWTSRVVIESCLYWLVKIDMIVWKILDSMVYTLGVFVVLKLVNKKDNVKINYLGCLLFMSYPYLDMSSAGWIATTTNYMWCFSFGALSFLPLILKDKKIKYKWGLYVVSILGLLYGANHEQSCLVILGLNVLYLIYTKFIKKEKIDKYNLVCTILSIFSFIFIITCPGNMLRLDDGVFTEFPDWKSFSLIQKLYFGIVPTLDVFLSNKLILILFSIILVIGVFTYSKKNFSKVISILNLLLVIFLTIGKDILIGFFPHVSMIFDAFSSHQPFYILYAPQTLALITTLIVFVSFAYMIMVVFRKDNLLPIVLFCLGIGSRMMMGFSHTVFISGPRTALYLFMAMIIIMLLIIYKLYDDKKYNKSFENMLFSVFSFLAIFSFLNILLQILYF